MTAPLDEKAFEIALGCYSEGGCSGLDERERREVVTDIISAYLAASPSPSEMEVVAWDVAFPGLPSDPTKSAAIAAEAEGQGGIAEPLVTLSQAQSALAARDAQVLRLTAEIEALRKDAEPELSCPHLDAFISATNPPAEVIEEIETARNINSQLRYGLWHEKARAEAAEARIKALEDALRPFAAVADALPEDQFANSYTPIGKDVLPSMRSFRTARSALKENAL